MLTPTLYAGKMCKMSGLCEPRRPTKEGDREDYRTNVWGNGYLDDLPRAGLRYRVFSIP